MKCIGTHDGKFHCDEVLACYMLKTLTEFKDHVIMRTRDPEKLKECDIVVDVGGVYDSNKRLFDHHQREFNETMKSLKTLDFDTKLSSAGLIYKHYGKQFIVSALKMTSYDDRVINLLYHKLYENVIHGVDANDNGVSQFDGPPLYKLPCTLMDRVAALNPSWKSNDNSDKKFEQAMNMVGEDVKKVLEDLYVSWLPARELVQKAVDERKKHHPSGKILVLEESACPWKDHFMAIEEEQGLKNEDITYIVFKDMKGDNWRIMAIPVDKNSQFENRGPLPKEWCGFRDEKLSEITNIEGCIFVHSTGFIGGNKTFEGAMKMAEKALNILGKWKSN